MTRRYSSTAIATTLAAGCTDVATVIQVTATTGFPAVDFVLALDHEDALQELVLVTNVSGTTLTVTRGYDSTTPVAHSGGASVRHVHTAQDFRDSRTHEDAVAGIHGATGSVVGTTDAQVLTNKTLDLANNTVTGTASNFNAALTDGDFATQAGAETLTNKTISADSNTLSGIAASSFVLSNGSGNIDGAAAQKVIPAGVVVGTTDAQTLTNKTLTSPTISDPTITGIGRVTFVLKTADRSRSGTTTMADDDHLFLTVPAAGTYDIDLWLGAKTATDAAGDIRVGFAFPTGTIYVHHFGITSSLASGTEGDLKAPFGFGASPFLLSTFGLSANDSSLHLHAVLVATASGTLSFQWAQGVSHASATTVVAGSSMLMRRVS